MSDDGGIGEYVALNRLDLLVEIVSGLQGGLGARLWDQITTDNPDVNGATRMAAYAQVLANTAGVILLEIMKYAPMPCPECGGSLGCTRSAEEQAAELIGVIDRNKVYLDERDEAVVDTIRRKLV